MEFTYDDCDSYQNELAELYSYSEMFDYSNNVKAYRMIAEEKQVILPCFKKMCKISKPRIVIVFLKGLINCVFSGVYSIFIIVSQSTEGSYNGDNLEIRIGRC